MLPTGRKVRLISTALHAYAGRLIYCSSEFEADEADVDSLLARGLARRIQTADLNGATKGTLRLKRSYRRRDLEAEH